MKISELSENFSAIFLWHKLKLFSCCNWSENSIVYFQIHSQMKWKVGPPRKLDLHPIQSNFHPIFVDLMRSRSKAVTWTARWNQLLYVNALFAILWSHEKNRKCPRLEACKLQAESINSCPYTGYWLVCNMGLGICVLYETQGLNLVLSLC